MLNLLKYFKKEYEVLNSIEVSSNNLISNYKYLSSLDEQSSRASRTKKVKVAPVLKSNGYGSGIINVAKILQSQNPKFYCVDSLHEAYQLLKAKIKIPVLITGLTNPENLRTKKLPFSYSLFTLDLAKAVNKYQPQAGLHIFIDTGMRREGVTIDELPEFLESLKQFPKLNIKGVMTHLASTKGSSDSIFKLQISNFKKALSIFSKYKIKPKWIHIAASGGLINKQTNKIISNLSNLSRAGISLYGIGDDKNLKPVLKLVTHLGQIKTLKKGEKVGYDGTYVAKEDMLIGILPIGYFDGVDRGLSNKGIVKINNIDCKIIGRVSMNLTTIDISQIKNPKVGMKVIVYSNNPTDKNSIGNVAKICNKIPYEILVNLSDSTRRIIV